MSLSRPRRGPVAMVVHSYYEEDPRVRREAEALLAAGRAVDVIALRAPGTAAEETVAGVRVTRLDVQRHQGAGLVTYLLEYLSFLARACVALVRAHARRRYRLVQVHSLPDFLVFAALPLRLAGVPVLLDLHEAMPEFFRTRFPRASSPLAHAALRLQERLSILAATHVITVNEPLVQRLVALGIPAAKVGCVTNAPSLARFDRAAHPVRPFAADGTIRVVYAGALTPTYEVEVAVEALAVLRARRPDLEVRLEVYGRGDAADALAELGREREVASRVTLHGRIPLDAVPAAIAAADIGIAPTRRNAFTDYSLSTKIFEYAAMGKPVVCSRLPLVEAVFPPGTVRTYAPGDAASLARELEALAGDAAEREAAVARTASLVAERSWERESVRYLDLVEALIAGRAPAPGASA